MKTIQDYIDFVESIPEYRWCVYEENGPNGKHCFYGHMQTLGCLFLFKELFDKCCLMVEVNDGYDPRYQQPTPKQRVLAALYDKKADLIVKEAQEIANTQNVGTDVAVY